MKLGRNVTQESHCWGLPSWGSLLRGLPHWSPHVWMGPLILFKTDRNKQCNLHCWSFLVRCSFLLGWGRACFAQTFCFVNFYWKNEQKWNSGVSWLRVHFLSLSEALKSKQCSPHCWSFLVRCSFLLDWGEGLWCPSPFCPLLWTEMNRHGTQESHCWGFPSWVPLKPSKKSNAALIVEAFWLDALFFWVGGGLVVPEPCLSIVIEKWTEVKLRSLTVDGSLLESLWGLQK